MRILYIISSLYWKGGCNDNGKYQDIQYIFYHIFSEIWRSFKLSIEKMATIYRSFWSCQVGKLLVVKYTVRREEKTFFISCILIDIVLYRHQSLLNEESKSLTRNPGMSLSKLMAGNSTSVELTLPGRKSFCFRMVYSSCPGIFCLCRFFQNQE